jgi:hypothetical protein
MRRYYNKGNKSWWPALRALHERMEIGDLVWSRNWDGVYFLGRVHGQWQYSNDPAHRSADIVNFRRCKWYRAGLVDDVPGAVRNSFSRGRTLQRVEDEAAAAYSKRLLNRLSRRNYFREAPPSEDFFGLLSPGAAEDLVGLYLQSRGYSMVPSSCHRTTAKYEFVLRHRRTGEIASLQVKTGRAPLCRDDFAELPGRVFLFAASQDYRGRRRSNVSCISSSQLRLFARRNRHLLPRTITTWLPPVEPRTISNRGG